MFLSLHSYCFVYYFYIYMVINPYIRLTIYYCNWRIAFLYTSNPHTGTRSVRYCRKDKRIGLENAKYLKKSFQKEA